MQLQELFNALLAGKTITVDHFSKRDYDSLVVSVRRKFRLYCKLFEDLGTPNPYEGQYVKITWNPDTSQGTYQLAPQEQRQTARKSYSATSL